MIRDAFVLSYAQATPARLTIASRTRLTTARAFDSARPS
jgi:hypothetical protein